jgi:hypothetical protein
MNKEVKKILIIPARFIEIIEDGKYVINCLIQNKPKSIIEKRLFESFLLKGIDNPNLLFIGILTGVGVMQINFIDANEYEDLFKKKWSELLK